VRFVDRSDEFLKCLEVFAASPFLCYRPFVEIVLDLNTKNKLDLCRATKMQPIFLVSLGLCENAKVRLSDFGMIRAMIWCKIAKRARPMNI